MEFIRWATIYFIIPFIVFPIWLYVVLYIGAKGWTFGRMRAIEDFTKTSFDNVLKGETYEEEKQKI